jgi:hypothetical protein
MPSVASPYGFLPVNRIGGLPYAGATREFLVDPAGYNTNIFTGSIVYVNGSGYINIVTADGTDGTTNAWPAGTTLTGAIGIFMGCEYVNSSGQVVHSPYYPANTVAPTGTSIKCKVVDDPDIVMQCQSAAAIDQAELGANAIMNAVQSTSTGSTLTGRSNTAISGTSETTTAPFRIIGFVSPAGETYTDVLVKFNPGWHAYTQVVGI